MSDLNESEVLSLLQPDLLTVDELLKKIHSRCSRIKNLSSMTKEGLVGLFRQIILPYPQRIYRANRRGKILTSRRTNADLESRRKDERSGFSNDRLKPPPDASSPQTVRINSQREKKQPDLERVAISERKECSRGESENKDDDHETRSLSSRRNFSLKRPFGYEKSGPPPQGQNKRPRTTIRWP